MLEPILPKRTTLGVAARRQRAVRRLSELGTDLLAEASAYEAPPSESYTRTGTLGKSWSKEGPKTEGSDIVVIVKSSGQIAPYNKYVRGFKAREPKQAERMASRGWLSIDVILQHHWPAARADLVKILTG